MSANHFHQTNRDRQFTSNGAVPESDQLDPLAVLLNTSRVPLPSSAEWDQLWVQIESELDRQTALEERRKSAVRIFRSQSGMIVKAVAIAAAALVAFLLFRPWIGSEIPGVTSEVDLVDTNASSQSRRAIVGEFEVGFGQTMVYDVDGDSVMVVSDVDQARADQIDEFFLMLNRFELYRPLIASNRDEPNPFGSTRLP